MSDEDVSDVDSYEEIEAEVDSDDAEPLSFINQETVAATVDGVSRVATVKSIIRPDNDNILIQAAVRYATEDCEEFHTVAVVECLDDSSYVLKTFEPDRNPLLRHILATSEKTLAGTIMRLIEKTLPPKSSIRVAEELSNECKAWAKEEMVRLNNENRFRSTYGVQTIDKTGEDWKSFLEHDIHGGRFKPWGFNGTHAILKKDMMQADTNVPMLLTLAKDHPRLR